MKIEEIVPKISIIIPVYNCEMTLERCLESVLRQTYNNIEIICINDGSLDTSLNILNNYEQLDSRIIVINKKNEGVSATRNKGLEICTGEYLLFVDADDFISENMIKNLYLAIKDGYDIAVSGYTEINCGLSMEIYDYRECKSKSEFILNCIQNTGGVVCSKLYRTTLIKENNITFEKSITLSEDLVFALRVFLKANRFISVEKAEYFYDRKNEQVFNIDVLERLKKSLLVHDLIQKNLAEQDIIGKTEIIEKRLEGIIYVHLLGLVRNGEYANFQSISNEIEWRMKNMSFLEYNFLDRIWLILYKYNHTRISYAVCFIRMMLVKAIKYIKRN